MYLKDLTLRGFKSFASATKLRFEPGITAIVGPNGSGKSNIVDALAWVMGEQGAKSLRGQAMADVVFAGSSSRPALGRAQVDLTIDNSDGRLPIGFSEVTISRTMFRSGGSEYAINGTPVRLLDVQELLSDSGLGRQMHVIVGQGQLDAVLSATAQERRAFIDEAAGVAKHRSRKERALRKLSAMDANLLRVLDLIEEISRQLKPLARQAKAAQAAAGIQARVRYAGARLLAADHVLAAERFQREQANLAQLRTQTGEAEEGIRAASQLLEQARGRAAHEGQLAAQFQEQYRDYRELAGSFLAIQDVARERVSAAAAQPAAVSQNAVGLSQERAQEAEQEAAKTANAVIEAETALKEAKALSAGAQAAASGAASELSSQRLQLERAAEASRRSELERQRDIAQLDAAQARLAAARQAFEEASQRLAALPQAVQETGADTTASQADYQAASEQENEARQALSAQEQVERQAFEQLSRLQSKAETLANSLGQMESSKQGEQWGQTVVSASPKGTLGRLLEVETGWEDAIAALLGAMVSARVLEPGANPEALLLQNHTGRFGGLAGMVQTGGTPPEAQPGSALSKVLGPSNLFGAAAELLGDCWVAQDVEAAANLVDELTAQRGQRPVFVATKDGVVITSHSVRLPTQSGPSPMRLQAEHKQALRQAQEVEREANQLQQATLRLRGALSEATSRRQHALEELRRLDAQQAKVAREEARLQASRQAARSEVQRSQNALDLAEEAFQVAQTKAAKALETKVAPVPPSEEFLAPALQNLEDANAAVEEARAVETEARMAVHVARERSQAASRTARAFATAALELQAERDRQLEKQSRASAVQTRANQLVQRSAAARKEALEGAERTGALRANHAQLADAAAAEVDRYQTQLANLEARRGGAREHLLQAEVAFAQIQAAFEASLEKIATFVGDADADVDEFLAEFGPHQPWNSPESKDAPAAFDRDVAEAELSDAERKLARLGVVNPLAVEEHAALKARMEFLESQVADVNRSKADLMSLIREVDAQVKESFLSAFADTAHEFEKVFTTLFPGGRGRLELTDPDDPLETGVEIYARPVGKKVSKLSLLSGGERSLAALAYLIAIFRARPSPFYIMDEVEAALDDTNLSRVLRLFEDLRDKSQLLVITHQKRTMEIADALYGVSMKDGVSAVVSHRMDRKE